jgi:hypothetical protein
MADFRWILLAAGLFTACSQENMGGGTELPGPITVIFTSSGSGRLVARQARIWSVDSTSLDSIRLTSRGILFDSSDTILLPPDSGTYLLEAWSAETAPESLSLHAAIPSSKFPDSSCRQILGRKTGAQGVESCGDTSASPSRQSGGSSPNLVALVHISGSATHPFRILDNGNERTFGEIRLWSVEGSDSLVFRGQLGVSGDSIGRLPTLTWQHKYVIEAWTPGKSAPGRVAVRRWASRASTAWNACAGSTLGSLGPSVISLFSCDLSPSPFPDDGATLWSAVELWPL